MMKKLILFLFLWPLLIQASTYTASWCPVNPTGYNLIDSWYQTCIEASQPTTPDCIGPLDGSRTTSYSVTLPDTVTVWFRVRMAILYRDNSGVVHYLPGPFSNPIQIIGGLTPPSIGGCSL